MNITEVKIKKIFQEGKVKAIASMTIDNAIVVHDIKIIECETKRFIAMPRKKVGEVFLDIVHPIDAESRALMESVILSAFDKNNQAEGDK